MSTPELRLECMRLAVGVREARMTPQSLVEIAMVFEQYVAGTATPEPTPPPSPGGRGPKAKRDTSIMT